MKIPALYASIWPRLTPHLRLAEQMLVPDGAWHQYEIDWQPDSVTWRIDGQVVARAEGWNPLEWRSVTEQVAKTVAWSKPLIPAPGDPGAFVGSPALV